MSLAQYNKNAIGGNRIGIAPADFKLRLESGTNITPGPISYWSADPESTENSDPIVFTIPAGTRPKALNLFYDNIWVSIDVSLN